MGREVRKVPANWVHPKNGDRFIPLFDGSYKQYAEAWDAECAEWNAGVFPSYASEESRKMSFEEWSGDRPSQDDCMPEWPESECTHYMMYETCSEGTPISPAFETPEQLARWLADNGASALGSQTADYESWLRVANGGYACSAVISGGVLRSGVEAL